MSVFVGFGAYAGGLYLEGIGTLYTYQRTPEESTYTVEELIQHEFGHYLQGRYVYPGIWGESGYHDEPKGWADEGLAEFLGGLIFEEGGGYISPIPSKHLDIICGVESYRGLASLLGQREGYDQAGVFDYNNGWAFVYYLMTQRKAEALNVYVSFRNSTYALADFAVIAGVLSVAELESDWHTAVGGWCDDYLGSSVEQAGETSTPGPSGQFEIGVVQQPQGPEPSI